MIKFLHFSDLHIGVDRTGKIDIDSGLSMRVMDYLKALDNIINFVKDEGIDLVLFAGDAFHTNSPSTSHIIEFSKRLNELRKLCNVVLIPGNHDVRRIDAASTLNVYSSLDIDNITLIDRVSARTIHTSNGDVQIVGLPYPSRHIVPQGIELSPREYVVNELNNISKTLDKSIPAILIAHLTVQNAIFGNERNYMTMDSEFSIQNLLRYDWNYIALGHIHKMQVINDNPLAIYSGSVERVSFNEEEESKGFIYGEIDNGNTYAEFVELPAREYLTIDVNIDNSVDDIEKFTAKIIKEYNVVDKFVRIRIYLDDARYNHSFESNKLVKLLTKAFHYVFEIKRPHISTSRDVIKQYDMIENTPIENLKVYLESRGMTMDEMLPILKTGKKIMAEVDNV